MHLVLVAAQRMAAVYGSGYPAIAAALDTALAARTASGITSMRYDPEAGLPALNIPPVPAESAALAAQLAAIEAALATQNAIIESLWIIGGPTLVPFGSLPNPMPDSDGVLLSDAPYGLADAAAPLMKWPVGRTPDAEPHAPGLLARLLNHVAAVHRAGPQAPGAVTALAAAVWADVTSALLAQAGVTSRPLLAPPLEPGSAAFDDLFAGRRIVCNIHGVRRAAAWLGQLQAGAPLIAALQPSDLAGRDLRGKVVISQACYGARLNRVEATEALAIGLLAAGLDGLVAPPGLAYGSLEPPPTASDVLVAALITALAQPGCRLGAAVLAAQTEFLRAALLRGGPDADEIKTLLGFVLYGDPALPWVH
ncbi:MAG: hypothetical protein HC822_26445 [Oscillochloris sp.]|nr:hypothetical protein [Oscillochloris sp.]